MPKNTRSNHHSKCLVVAGKKTSVNGLKKKDILKRAKTSAAVKKGHKPMCISKKKHQAGKRQAKHRKSWIYACQQAKKKLKITGFVPIKKGTRLYELAKKLHASAQKKPSTKSPIAARTRARTRQQARQQAPVASRTRGAMRR